MQESDALYLQDQASVHNIGYGAYRHQPVDYRSLQVALVEGIAMAAECEWVPN